MLGRKFTEQEPKLDFLFTHNIPAFEAEELAQTKTFCGKLKKKLCVKKVRLKYMFGSNYSVMVLN